MKTEIRELAVDQYVDQQLTTGRTLNTLPAARMFVNDFWEAFPEFKKLGFEATYQYLETHVAANQSLFRDELMGKSNDNWWKDELKRHGETQ